MIISSAKSDSLIFSLPIWMPFISFCYPIALARTSSAMLNRSGGSGHSCLVQFSVEIFPAFAPQYDVGYGFATDSSDYFEIFPLIPNLLRAFNKKIC